MPRLDPKSASSLLTCQNPNPRARLRLFCLPFAGGGTWIFRDWSQALPGAVEVHAIQLPGRERRIREEGFTRLEPMAAAVAGALEAYLDEGPIAIFGHSMGAILGFEVTRLLRDRRGAEPVRLFASGHRAPHFPDPEDPIRDLPHDQFIEALRELNGTPPEVFASPELLDLVVPILRADFSVCETYRCQDGPPLGCPITVFGGLQDAEADRPSLEAWAEHTSGGCVVRMFPGDHFFIQTARSTVLSTLSVELDRLLAEHGGS